MIFPPPPPTPNPTPSAPRPGNHLTITMSLTLKQTPLAGVSLQLDENVATIFQLSIICSVFAHTVTTTAATTHTRMIFPPPPPAPNPTPSAPHPGDHLTTINISHAQTHIPCRGVSATRLKRAAVFLLSLICSVFAHTVTTTAVTVKATLSQDQTPGKRRSTPSPHIMMFLFILSQYTVRLK